MLIWKKIARAPAWELMIRWMSDIPFSQGLASSGRSDWTETAEGQSRGPVAQTSKRLSSPLPAQKRMGALETPKHLCKRSENLWEICICWRKSPGFHCPTAGGPQSSWSRWGWSPTRAEGQEPRRWLRWGHPPWESWRVWSPFCLPLAKYAQYIQIQIITLSIQYPTQTGMVGDLLMKGFCWLFQTPDPVVETVGSVEPPGRLLDISPVKFLRFYPLAGFAGVFQEKFGNLLDISWRFSAYRFVETRINCLILIFLKHLFHMTPSDSPRVVSTLQSAGLEL